MTPVKPNREQWWVILAAYVVVLFVQRDNLREPLIATAMVLLGAALLMWWLSSAKTAPAPSTTEASAPMSTVAIVGGIAALAVGVLVISNWSASRSAVAPVTNEPISNVPFDAAAVPQEGMPPQTYPGLPATADPSGQPPIGPLELLQEFQTNDFNADNKYRGRFIQVTGVVAAIPELYNEVPYVQLGIRPSRPDLLMSAVFHENRSQVRSLKVGDRVLLRCSPVYDGDMDSVTLNDCSLVQ